MLFKVSRNKNKSSLCVSENELSANTYIKYFALYCFKSKEIIRLKSHFLFFKTESKSIYVNKKNVIKSQAISLIVTKRSNITIKTICLIKMQYNVSLSFNLNYV